MNETIHSLLNRRSVRSYIDQPVEQDKINLILACGQFAPSANNRQPWHFSVITQRSLLDKITEANRAFMLNSGVERMVERAKDPAYDSFVGAPMAVIVSGEVNAKYAMADCANAIENMAVAAFSLGLGSCYLASFKMVLETEEGAALRQACGIPEGFMPQFALSIGYANQPLGERAPRRENTVSVVS